jgi:uncharacterized membrane protein YhaH (DUF805 family)
VTVGQWYVRRGRISRRVFWLHYTLPMWAASLVAAYLDSDLELWIIEPQPGMSGGGVLSTALALALTVPSFSSLVTRLHDRDHSAWFLLWIFLPFFGALLLFIQTWFLPGDDDANRFGPPTTQRRVDERVDF